MGQLFSPIPATKSLKDSRTHINDNIEAVASQFAGTAFPTANLYIGQPCYRTDLGKLYVLKDLTPTWLMVFDGKTFLEDWNKQGDLASSGTDLNNITTAGWYHQPATAGATAGLNYPTPNAGLLQVFTASSMVYQFYTSYGPSTPASFWRTRYNGTWGAWARTLTVNDEGAGKGLDADTVDGYQTATAATANTIPVRDAGGKLAGDITGNAATATSALAAPWSGITGKPTTLAGYGIADITWETLTGKPTTIDGYGITDAVKQGGTISSPPKTSSAIPAAIMVGPNATYDFGVVHDSNGVMNFSRYSKAGAWNTTLAMLSDAGNFTAGGNITAYSDVRLKKDLQVIEGALAKVNALTGYTYTRKDTGERQVGLVAQDVQRVLPEAVLEGADEQKTLSVAYGNMVGLLVEAVKELCDRVERLERAA